MKEADVFFQEFGVEAVRHRLFLSHLHVWGTQVGACIRPERDPAATLDKAWRTVQALARYLLSEVAILPADERYEIIVGWSRSVRPLQGQIFKLGGDAARLKLICSCQSYLDYEANSGQAALRLNWQKDVFRLIV